MLSPVVARFSEPIKRVLPVNRGDFSTEFTTRGLMERCIITDTRNNLQKHMAGPLQGGLENFVEDMIDKRITELSMV